MNTAQFREILQTLLLKQSQFRLPRFPKTEHDQALYLEFAGRYLCPSYQPDWPQKAWYNSPEIQEFVKHFPNEWRGFNLDRHYNLLQLLKLIEGVAGDTAECGVFQGASSWLMLRFAPDYDGKGRMHYAFDSYEGVSEPGAEDGSHWRKGDMACSLNQVQQALSQFGSRCVFYKGWIPEKFPEVENRQFAFAHVDVDLADPTRQSVEFFYPRLAKGGILLCDDYGFTTCPGATKALDEYLDGKPEQMIGLASGGGYFIKHD